MGHRSRGRDEQNRQSCRPGGREAMLHASHGPHGPGERDLAHETGSRGSGVSRAGRSKRSRHRQVGPRIVQPKPSRRGPEELRTAQPEPQGTVGDGRHDVEPAGVETRDLPPGRPGRGNDQRLNVDGERPPTCQGQRGGTPGPASPPPSQGSASRMVWIESITRTSGDSTMAAPSTSERSRPATYPSRSPSMPRRRARAATWARASSPEAMRQGCPAPAKRDASWRRRVDLPMPGAPARRTADPRTSPPPSTRSTLGKPVESR